ncbi:50S ribosomal protein L4 [Candidatus Woesearchaeota archaeon]|nr:50S ribosomal protein L4 [Candidatus Woesearchaeota archaeon]
MTTAKIFSLQGTELKSISLPEQFDEEINQDLIKRAVLVLQQNSRQRYGAFEEAGKRPSAKLSKRRRDYRGSYGKGISRVSRKIMWKRGSQFGWEGAFSPGTKGGRKAHPPKPEKLFSAKINKKEKRKSIRSAIAATAVKDFVSVRHKVPNHIPIVVESKFESLNKTKQVKDLLLKIGLKDELERISDKRIRAGKGKTRNRKYKIKRGPLIVISDHCFLEKASRNLQGIETSLVENLNAEVLAPGAIPGRLVVWSETAITKMGKEKLFTNNQVKKEEKAK